MTPLSRVLASDMTLIQDDNRGLHPAWLAFQEEMSGMEYGSGPLNAAWSFFKAGWDAAGTGER